VLLVAGESLPEAGLGVRLDSVATIYDVKRGNGEIRRINVNVAPLTVDEFRALKASGIGTYQLFQETYHRETYERMHVAARSATTTGASPPCTAPWRRASTTSASACSSASSTGASRSSPSCSTSASSSAPTAWARTRSACRARTGRSAATWPCEPPFPVDDVDFRKLVAILRLAVPYTGMIMSTRETPNIRRETFALGVSQISAGSRTNPGGYVEDEHFDEAQFQLGDHRALDEVIRDVAELGYIPSFCTACYRLGRTGMDFMDLAKPGRWSRSARRPRGAGPATRSAPARRP
jgi:2-iminoacetate synthase